MALSPRKYTAEFKQRAVQLWRESGTSYAEVARGLGIDESSLRAWVKKAGESSGGAGARPLSRVVSEAYGVQPVVFTTNLEFSRWGSVFGDDQMAAAVTGRVIHHGRLPRFRGESYRVRHALMQ